MYEKLHYFVYNKFFIYIFSGNKTFAVADSMYGHPGGVTLFKSPMIPKSDRACIMFDYKIPAELSGLTFSVSILYTVYLYNFFFNIDTIKSQNRFILSSNLMKYILLYHTIHQKIIGFLNNWF